MEVSKYLDRISFQGQIIPNLDTLRALHRAHMLNVPFENLDIPLNQKIILSIPSLYEKIVHRRRGGFCYELNGLFSWLLEQIGYQVTLHSARVFDDGEAGPEFDHMILQVHLEDKWLADVGFGELFLKPIQLVEDIEQEQQGSLFKLTCLDEVWTLHRQQPGSDWEPQYSFTLITRSLADFSEMCEYHQTSPHSSFTKERLCTLATETGRITLSEMRLITTEGGVREEVELLDLDQYIDILRDKFGVEIPNVEKLFHVDEF